MVSHHGEQFIFPDRWNNLKFSFPQVLTVHVVESDSSMNCDLGLNCTD